MYTWSGYPFVRLIIPFVFGILTAIYAPFNLPAIQYVISALLLVLTLIVCFRKFRLSYGKEFWFGILLTVLLFLLAYQLTIFKTEKHNPNHYSNYIKGTQLVRAKLTDASIEKEKTIKIVAEIEAVKQNNCWKRTCGKAMISIRKDSSSLTLKYGDEILLNANFKEVAEPQNPGEFNYKRFLAFHNVSYQAFISERSWIFTGTNEGNILYKYANKLRDNLLKVLSSNGLGGDEYAVGGALLLGYVDKLDADIITAYASTGALHVLSVSGMHVGLIYLVLNFFLSFLDKWKKGRIIKAVISILFIWFYATLTGLSPAVLRSAVMLSFIITGKAVNRRANIYNTLAASVFFLLLINPYLIMDVGFQLSYIAVVGIVYLQPKIYSWYDTDRWLIDNIWKLTAVSIAAQLATFPLGLLYFHQFPNYFLLSNLVVIPISTIVIYIGISVFTLAKIPMLLKVLAILFNWGIWFLNGSVKLIEHLPNALIQGISIGIFETFLIYFIIILFLYYFENRRVKYLVYALSALIIILSIQVKDQYTEFHQKKFVVYNIAKTSAIDFISSKTNVLLTDSTFAKNESALLFHVKHNWWNLGLNENKIISDSVTTNTLSINKNFIRFYDKTIVVLNSLSMLKNIELVITSPLTIDYLIISRNPYIKMENVLKLLHPKEIIFDCSNTKYHLNKWKSECRRLNQNYFSISDSGAMTVDL